jgi:hypothetical protein
LPGEQVACSVPAVLRARALPARLPVSLLYIYTYYMYIYMYTCVIFYRSRNLRMHTSNR